MKGRVWAFLAVLVLMGVVLWVVTHRVPVIAPLTLSEAGDWQQVERVIDGDTIQLASGERVRYIGIDTPETVKPDAPVGCYGHEASARNRELVEGKRVHLTRDISDRDRYGRLLRFVTLEDGTQVNETLVREGYARLSTFPPDVSRAEVYRQAQQKAREEHRGLWAGCEK